MLVKDFVKFAGSVVDSISELSPRLPFHVVAKNTHTEYRLKEEGTAFSCEVVFPSYVRVYDKRYV